MTYPGFFGTSQAPFPCNFIQKLELGRRLRIKWLQHRPNSSRHYITATERHMCVTCKVKVECTSVFAYRLVDSLETSAARKQPCIPDNE